MTTERRLIVLSEPQGPDLDRVEGLAIQVQVELGPLLERGPSETRASGVVRHAWRERRPHTSASPLWMIVTINPEVPACWLELVGGDATTLDRLEALARRELGAPSWRELEAATLAAPHSEGAITRLALGAPSSARGAVLVAVRGGLSSTSPSARMDAALAAVSAGLGDALEDVERAAATERDEEVLATLRWAAESLPSTRR